MQPLSPNDSREVGPYRVIAELGRGAMGRVLLGAGPDGRPVAVKVIREWLVEDEDFRARFREEVRKSRQVSGQYTASVVKAGPDDPVPWLASEFLHGPTLTAAIEAGGPLPEAAVLRLAAGLASALESIHEAGLIHRDLKPSNVILGSDGPRVIDFGIARAAEGGPDLTRTGAVVGTPGFMSPEQALSEPLTAASDMFSLGSVLAMACIGTSPFVAASTLRTLNNVVRASPDLTGLPERVRAIAARCLAADPADRPTPTELLELIGPIEPTSRPWPDTVSALADAQHRDLVRFLDNAGEDPTLIDNGPTLVTDPNRPTWVGQPPAPPGPGSPPRPPVVPEPRPPRDEPKPPQPRPPAAGSKPSANSGSGGVIALLVCVAAVAAILWYQTRDDTPGTDEESDEHATYVQDCQDAGYAESDCETSWVNDASYTWTGQLYSDDSGGVETGDGETYAPSDQEVYVQDCQDAGYSQSECETSWVNDSSYTWTGQLYSDDSETDVADQREAYLEECQWAGYTEAQCDASWFADSSFTWTGQLYE